MIGKVSKCLSQTVVVKTQDGKTFECVLRGAFKKEKTSVVPGDNVEFDETKKVVESVLPRKNILKRPVVANADQIFLVVAPEPAPDLFLVDQMAIYARQNNMDLFLVANKEDLHEAKFLKNLHEQYDGVIEKILVVSAKTGAGLDDLMQNLKGKLTIFAGQSGVGKSSLLNAILPDAGQATSALSAKISRGINTTRTSEIFDLSKVNGQIVDTPGFSLITLDIDPRDIARYCPDIMRFACDCDWGSCTHIGKTPEECGVVRAALSGKLNNERYARFVKLYEKYQKEYKLKQKRGTLYGHKNH